jgi:hypothetical protein
MVVLLSRDIFNVNAVALSFALFCGAVNGGNAHILHYHHAGNGPASRQDTEKLKKVRRIFQ